MAMASSLALVFSPFLDLGRRILLGLMVSIISCYLTEKNYRWCLLPLSVRRKSVTIDPATAIVFMADVYALSLGVRMKCMKHKTVHSVGE
ncbi:hypothetical protein D3C72_1129980 [compost metagenome]